MPVASAMMDLCCQVGLACSAVLVVILIAPLNPVFQIVHQGTTKTQLILSVSKHSN